TRSTRDWSSDVCSSDLSFVPAITAHNSTIQGNGVGIDSETLAVQDASANWWGCAAGPGSAGCDTVTGNVDVSSSLGSPATCAACATSTDCDLNGADPRCNDSAC